MFSKILIEKISKEYRWNRKPQIPNSDEIQTSKINHKNQVAEYKTNDGMRTERY